MEVAKKLRFRGLDYEYSHSKDNILTYIRQPFHHYEDWEEEGGILVVKYRHLPNEKDIKDRYVVLHQLIVTYRNGYIDECDISNVDKIPEIIEN